MEMEDTMGKSVMIQMSNKDEYNVAEPLEEVMEKIRFADACDEKQEAK
jgi:uncharacterized protein YlzI (FlbEa/FlbD family)